MKPCRKIFFGVDCMTAKESHPNFSAKLREMTNYTVREIKKVCSQIGPRPSGEENERKAQAYVAESMKNVADSVAIEDFELHPKAFMGWVPLDVIFVSISIVLLLLRFFGVAPEAATVFSALACVLTGAAVVITVFEFLFYKKFLDPFFPKRKSCNVICTRKATGETKRRIIFSGHIDSAYEWYFTHLGGGKFLTVMIALGFGAVGLTLAVSILSFFDVPQGLRIACMVVLFIALVPVLMCSKFVNWKLCVPGANDNLTGVFASMSVMRYMAANDVRFENTEVVCVSMACEEAGLRGAKAYAEKHAGEDDVETLFIGTDTLRDFADMGVYNKDMTGMVTLDKQGAAMLRHASDLAGYNLPYAKVFFGSSDAAAIAQGGMKAVALAAMDPTPARYYHTRGDTADNLDPKTIEAGIHILLEAAFLFDREGLKDEY